MILTFTPEHWVAFLGRITVEQWERGNRLPPDLFPQEEPQS